MPPEIELWYGHIKMATLWGLPMGETANIIGLAEIYERRGRRPWRGDNTTIIRDTFKAWPAEGQRRQIKNSLNGFEIWIMYSPWWSQLVVLFSYEAYYFSAWTVFWCLEVFNEAAIRTWIFECIPGPYCFDFDFQDIDEARADTSHWRGDSCNTSPEAWPWRRLQSSE